MDSKSILRHHVGNVISLLQHVHQSLEKQSNDNQVRSFPDAIDMIDRSRMMVRTHRKGLESFLHTKHLPITPQEKKTDATFLSLVTGIMDYSRKEDLVSMYLQEDYMALSLVCATYTMLEGIAQALREPKLSEDLLLYQQEIDSLLLQKKQLLPVVAVNEMSREGNWVEFPMNPRGLMSRKYD